MNIEERFKEMATLAQDAIEDFNDFADDRAIAWAYAEINRLTHERNILAEGIGEAVVSAGITQNVPMTGPELLLMLKELTASRSYSAGLARAAEIVLGMAKDERTEWNLSDAHSAIEAAIRAEADSPQVCLSRGFTADEAAAYSSFLEEVFHDAPQVCEWTYDDNEYAPKWDSSCGEAWCFIEGGPAENRVKFCQGCGKAIAIKEG